MADGFALASGEPVLVNLTPRPARATPWAG